MSTKPRRRFVALAALFAQRFPNRDLDPEIRARRLWVDGQLATNRNAHVCADAALRLREPRKLRGTIKLEHALEVFGISVSRRTCADVGAAAGGFTTALLTAGAARVYAIDTAVGQFIGRLRADPRVVNLEGQNLGALSRRQVPEPIDIITIDLSYLSLASAIPQLEALDIAASADLIALVKPTFELRSGTLADSDADVTAAVANAEAGIRKDGWTPVHTAPAPRTGRGGAVEVFVHAIRG